MTNLIYKPSHSTWKHPLEHFESMDPHTLSEKVIHLQSGQMRKKGVGMGKSVSTTYYSYQTFLKGQQTFP